MSASTEIWARDLRSLFEHAKARFGDVSWESEEGGERIWAHKGELIAPCLHLRSSKLTLISAVIYARAPSESYDATYCLI